MKKNSHKQQLRKFGFLIAFGFPLIIGWFLPMISGHMFRTWTLIIGITSLFIAISNPALLKYPYKGWMQLGHILGLVNSKIILGLVFILVLLPISLIMKIFGYDPLKEKKVFLNSYREDKKGYKVDLERIF